MEAILYNNEITLNLQLKFNMETPKRVSNSFSFAPSDNSITLLQQSDVDCQSVCPADTKSLPLWSRILIAILIFTLIIITIIIIIIIIPFNKI
jgi:hypothetical protein